MPQARCIGGNDRSNHQKPLRRVIVARVSIEEAASRVGVSPRTVRNWIATGEIKGWRLPGGRLIRVDMDEINALTVEIPAVQR